MPATGEAVKPRNKISGWKALPSVSLTEAEGTLSRMAPVRLGIPVRLMSPASKMRVDSGTWSRFTSDPAKGVLLTTTMPNMGKTIDAFVDADLRDAVKIMVGGAPVTPEFAEDMGADGYGKDAMACVAIAKQLIGVGSGV